ncbi:hypothetical protein AB0E78_23845 [Streptomyces sp. NPDC032198]|uniref:DUF7691 family protein n=1 Tax=Streptomyces sp. NPDC032198 TaxID=3155127 RepID=UPI0033D67692
MSASLTVYLLDVAATRALISSRDQQLLLTVIRQNCGTQLAHADDEFPFDIKQGARSGWKDHVPLADPQVRAGEAAPLPRNCTEG